MFQIEKNSLFEQTRLLHYHPQVEECEYTDAEKKQSNMLTDDDDEFFKV